MDVSTNGHPARQHESDEYDSIPAGWRWTLPRALGIAAFFAMALFWIYAFANTGSIAHPDEFEDPTFTEAAEALCAKRQATIAALPLANGMDSLSERAVVVNEGTNELSLMVDELGELPLPTDAKGAAGVTDWLNDYQIFLKDRRDYADKLEQGIDDPFYVSGNADGVRVTNLLTTFAEVNNMASCGPSPDV